MTMFKRCRLPLFSLMLVPVFLVLAGGEMWAADTPGVADTDTTDTHATNTVLSVTDVQWEKLNPARGDQSPQAGVLWGGLATRQPTGFLAKFVDGFSSPPHAHNVTYRAVVISGLIHNDDPGASPMWMPPGSFWMQPKGEIHITAAKGEENIALVEIDQGPYLVKPTTEAFDSGERPINIDPSNLVWQTPLGRRPEANGPKQAFLWGALDEGSDNGTFIRLPPNFEGTIRAAGTSFRAVIISGRINYASTVTQVLAPGSYFSSEGEFVHRVNTEGTEPAVVYVRTNAPYDLSGGDQGG
ncbi:MAG: DUF4437 domain-containing protein [Pseudomonadota bacterium]